MNGFKVLAVGAFLFYGPSFCHAQIRILDNQAEPRSILINSSQEDGFQPAAAANLNRSRSVNAEVSINPFENSFPGDNESPSDVPVDSNAAPAPVSDPASLPVGIGHRHNPIDLILRNGMMYQTPNSAQVPICWPIQGPDNPTARMMSNTGCTEGLWANYPAERAAECAHMYKKLAGHQRGHGCGGHGCGGQGCGGQGCDTGCNSCGQTGRHSRPVNRYAPTACDSSPFMPASHETSQQAPQFESLLAPTPAAVKAEEAIAKESVDEVPENPNNVAQLPGLFR